MFKEVGVVGLGDVLGLVVVVGEGAGLSTLLASGWTHSGPVLSVKFRRRKSCALCIFLMKRHLRLPRLPQKLLPRCLLG